MIIIKENKATMIKKSLHILLIVKSKGESSFSLKNIFKAPIVSKNVIVKINFVANIIILIVILSYRLSL
jgi:hypothetical protein